MATFPNDVIIGEQVTNVKYCLNKEAVQKLQEDNCSIESIEGKCFDQLKIKSNLFEIMQFCFNT